MDYKTIEMLIPMPSDGLSPGDVVRMRAMINEALVTIADKIEAATDFDASPSMRHAIAAGLRGDQELRRDA
jgi:hypothetical protein